MTETATLVRSSSFSWLCRLARALADPVSTFAWSFLDLGALSDMQIRQLRRHPAFRQPLDRHLQTQLVGNLDMVSSEELQLLPETGAGRLLIMLLTEPQARVAQAALLTSAACMHRHVLRTAARRERRHLRDALGGAAFQVATIEAPMLYPALAKYADETLLQMVLAEDEAAARSTLVRWGAAMLAACGSLSCASLAALVEKRFPAARDVSPSRNLVPGDVQPMTRLLQRRMTSWAPYIA